MAARAELAATAALRNASHAGLVRVFQLAVKLNQAIAVVDAGNVLVGIDPFRFPPRNRTRQLGDAVAALKHGGPEFNSATSDSSGDWRSRG